MYLPLAILASFAFLYSIAAERIEKTPFTGPVVFISFGVLVGPLGLAWLKLEVTATEMRVLADLTLAMVRRLIDEGHVKGENFYQIGLNSVKPSGKDMEWMRKSGLKFHFMQDIDDRGLKSRNG
jgi:hypothetical protein